MDIKSDFLSRHALGFDLTGKTNDPTKSPYAEGFPDYPQKHGALSLVVGVTQFLWAVEPAQGFKYYEMVKPVEWVIRIDQGRVIGYIDDEKWFAFLRGTSPSLRNCFTKARPANGPFSVLLPFPLRRDELIGRREFKIHNPHRAQTVVDEAL